MADDLPALRPVVPHERPAGERAGCAGVAHAPRRQQLRRLGVRPRKALRSLHPRRLRDRRRDPLPAGRGRVQPRRARPDTELGDLPRRDGRLRRGARARPEDRAADRRSASLVPLPAARPECDAGDRERAPPGATRPQVLPHDHGGDRRQDRRRAAARHGRSAGLGALRAVGGPRGRARGDTRRRRGPGAPALRREGVLVEHRRVRLDSLAAPGRLLGCEPEALPRVAPCGGVRRRGVGRREPRLSARSRTTTSRPGISDTAATSSSTTTSSGARRSSGWPRGSIARRSHSRSTTRT